MFHVGQRNIILPNIAQKNHGLALMLFKSMLMQYDQLLFLLYLGSSLKMGAGTEPNEFARGRGFFKRKIQSNIFL